MLISALQIPPLCGPRLSDCKIKFHWNAWDEEHHVAIILGMIDIWLLLQRPTVKWLKYSGSVFPSPITSHAWQTRAGVAASPCFTRIILLRAIQDDNIQAGCQLFSWTSARKGEGRGKVESMSLPSEKLPTSFCLCPMNQTSELGDSTYLQGTLGNEVVILGICHTPYPICQICPESNPFSPFHCFHYGPSHFSFGWLIAT